MVITIDVTIKMLLFFLMLACHAIPNFIPSKVSTLEFCCRVAVNLFAVKQIVEHARKRYKNIPKSHFPVECANFLHPQKRKLKVVSDLLHIILGDEQWLSGKQIALEVSSPLEDLSWSSLDAL